MSGRRRNWGYGLLFPLFLAGAAARAGPPTTYTLSGPVGAITAEWGSPTGTEAPGAEALVVAFTAAVPVKTGAPPGVPGPRVVFSVNQWAVGNDAGVQRQWYGDWPLEPKALAIAGDLTQGTLDTPLLGTLVESSAGGMTVQRGVPGRLQVKWTGSSDLANITIADSFQTPGNTMALQVAGLGRTAMVTGTLTVPALGAPIPLQNAGSLTTVASGLLSVTMQ